MRVVGRVMCQWCCAVHMQQRMRQWLQTCTANTEAAPHANGHAVMESPVLWPRGYTLCAAGDERSACWRLHDHG